MDSHVAPKKFLFSLNFTYYGLIMAVIVIWIVYWVLRIRFLHFYVAASTDPDGCREGRWGVLCRPGMVAVQV